MPDEKNDRISLARRETNILSTSWRNAIASHMQTWLGIRRQSLQRKLKKFPPKR